MLISKKSMWLILFLQNVVIFALVYITSTSLRPFIDEIISLTSSIGFFSNFDFSSARDTVYGDSFSPNFTTGPFPAIGSALGWNITNNIYTLRIINFYFAYFLQIIFVIYLSKHYQIDKNKAIFFSSFVVTSVPWWFSSLYSLGDLICGLIFFNCILIYKHNRKIAIFLMGISVFFGRISYFLPFLGFYFVKIIKAKSKFSVALKDLMIFIIPAIAWIILIKLNYDNGDLKYYFNEYVDIIFTTNPSIEKFESNRSFFEFITQTLSSSDLTLWNSADYLRVLIAPLLIAFAIPFTHTFDKSFQSVFKFEILFSFLPFYLSFWLLSPTKSIIYSQVFTTMILFSTLYLFTNNEKQGFKNTLIPLFVVSFYMSSVFLVILFLVITSYLILSEKQKFLSIVVIIMLLFSQINSVYEVSKKDKFTEINMEDCITDLKSKDCIESYLDNEYIFSR
tara:strand:- start:19752 stop:21101 length:1350 start_codon:yes stop_codon:yes gene_type:complete